MISGHLQKGFLKIIFNSFNQRGSLLSLVSFKLSTDISENLPLFYSLYIFHNYSFAIKELCYLIICSCISTLNSAEGTPKGQARSITQNPAHVNIC